VTGIRLEAVSYVYPGGVRALDDVSLVVRAGEAVAIVGQNGSGKSTLVRHLDGLLRPARGRVIVGDRDASGSRVAQLARVVGLAFQDPDRQIFGASVRAEVAFGARNAGHARGDLERAVDDALALVGLSGAADENPYDLGYSRRKLLTLASVLAMRTPIVVLDEPTTGQDANGVRLVERIVRALSDEGRTVLAISHDMRFVAETFARVVVMRRGRVILDGTPTQVFAPENAAALRSTHLEPPIAAQVGARLDLGSTPTDASVVAALRQRDRGG
jgi:energy-coupling factor transport system ATP-binding protein